jgi:hypothetical protein
MLIFKLTCIAYKLYEQIEIKRELSIVSEMFQFKIFGAQT